MNVLLQGLSGGKNIVITKYDVFYFVDDTECYSCEYDQLSSKDDAPCPMVTCKGGCYVSYIMPLGKPE